MSIQTTEAEKEVMKRMNLLQASDCIMGVPWHHLEVLGDRMAVRAARFHIAETEKLNSQVQELQKTINLYKRYQDKPTDFGQESASYNNY